MKRQLLVAVDNGMACVVAALITDDVIVFASNEIGDLAFAFVAPLGANQNECWACVRILSITVSQPLTVYYRTTSVRPDRPRAWFQRFLHGRSAK